MKYFNLRFFLLILLIPSFSLASASQDFSISLKENLINKVISTKKTWEYEDKVQGIYLKLSNLKFEIINGSIIGSAKVNKFKQLNSSKNDLLGELMKHASDTNDIGTIKLLTQVGLNEDHQKIILKGTKFTSFDNRYLPRFVENNFILKELNKKFAKEIDGKIIYEFPKGFSVDIIDVKALNKEILIDGNLALPCNLGEVH